MNPKTVSIISTLVNLGLTIAKLSAGLLIGSVALLAEAIHSGMDIFSSAITWFGIKKAQEPKDKVHPYGHWRMESLAGIVVLVLLVVSAIWIFYEGITRIFQPQVLKWSFWTLIVMGVSAIVNEIMARIKFKVGKKYSSIALIADAEHSRADVIASVGLFIGLILIRYFVLADALIALLIGLYILYKSYGLGKEVADSLLDVANPKVERKIKQICDDLELKLKNLKTRKVGRINFAEMTILLDSRLKLDQATYASKEIEKILLDKIPNLKSITISVESHRVDQSAIKASLGLPTSFKRKVGKKKKKK